jgi:hypothetical protein
MKESRKEFIKKAHSAACSEWKKNIEKEFPKLFKEDALVVGKWYKYHDNYQESLMVWNNSEDTYGFWGNEYRDDLSFHISYDKIPATDKEVEEALIKEAKRRGFKKGVKFIRLSNGVIMTVDGLPYFQHGILSVLSPKTEWSSVYKGGCSNPFIFDNGKWATIVETITKEQAEKELGKTILN